MSTIDLVASSVFDDRESRNHAVHGGGVSNNPHHLNPVGLFQLHANGDWRRVLQVVGLALNTAVDSALAASADADQEWWSGYRELGAALDGGSALLLPTTASEHPISKRIRRVRAKNHLGSRASGSLGSFGVATRRSC